MSIDAVIEVVYRRENMTRLLLKPRRDQRGRLLSIAGRRELLITKNADYAPQIGDEIWGNSSEVVISKNKVDHKFRRIERIYGGGYQVK